MNKQQLGHSLHNMFITLKSKNEQSAHDYVNKLSIASRHVLASYWKKNNFGEYATLYLGM